MGRLNIGVQTAAVAIRQRHSSQFSRNFSNWLSSHAATREIHTLQKLRAARPECCAAPGYFRPRFGSIAGTGKIIVGIAGIKRRIGVNNSLINRFFDCVVRLLLTFAATAKHLNGQMLRQGNIGNGGFPQRDTVTIMKSSAPWSVKGIERDARETAKEAAKREGMTVGEWLNHMIYAAGDEQASGGEVEGLQLRDIVTAIEHLHKRVADTQANSGEAVQDATRKMGDVVERVQRLERTKPVEGSNEALFERLEALEQKTGDRDRVDALKALEKAVAQVAVQFNTAQKTSIERLDASERQIQDLAARIDSVSNDAIGGEVAGVDHLRDAIDGLSARIARTERLASEASKMRDEASGSIEPDFVEATSNQLRVLGDEIKRGGDQIRMLESTIVKLSNHIDAAERRSAEGIQKVAETLVDLRENLGGDAPGGTTRTEINAAVAAATRDTESKITALQSSFEDMIERLESFDGEIATGGDEEELSLEEPAIEISKIESTPEDQLEAISNEATDTSDEDANFLDDNSDNDEDPFSFADEIEAALETEDQTDPKEDFSFELDGGDNELDEREAQTGEHTDEPETAPEDSQNPDANALLSEVKRAFGSKESEPEKPTEEPKIEPLAETSTETEDDLDALLADLDDITADEPLPPPMAKSDQSEAVDRPEEKEEEKPEDYLKAARRRAKEVAARAAEQEKGSKRKLTAKQKAILAARARKKRALENKSANAPIQELKATTGPSPKNTSNDTETGTEEQENKSVASKLVAIRNKLPFVGKKNAENEDVPSQNDQDLKDEKAAFDTLKKTALARPVTLALGVGIFLTVAALFYLIKDVILKPGNDNSPVVTVQIDDAIVDGESSTNDGVDATPLTTDTSAINPRDLYLESMAALNDVDVADPSAAIEKLQQAAALGHPPAQLQLGELYKTGQGVELDLGRARTWFRRAANGGNVLAMHRIGVMTARGDGGPADTSEAISWFELAANQGLVDSQYNLGAIFHPTAEGGASTIQDAGKAYYWYSLAANNGDEQALPLAEGVAVVLTVDQKVELDQSISEWEPAPSDTLANELAPAT